MGRRIRYWLAGILIVILAAGLYLVGSGKVALWDRDEGWYAQASRQMLEGGNWVVPHYLDKPRYAKPIFIYWCQAASMHFFGVNSFAARLPSAIGMTATVLLLLIVLGLGIGIRRAMWTALIFATGAMVIISAKMCLTDAVMMFFITGAQFCLYGIYRARAGRHGPLSPPEPASTDAAPGKISTNKLAVLMWICIGMAGLTKGPFVLAVLFASMVALMLFDVGRRWRSAGAWANAIRWWRATRPLWGIGIIVAIVAPWLITFAVTNPHALWEMLQEPAKHMATDKDGHAQPPGYFLATIWLTDFPWSLLLPAGLVAGWKFRRTPAIRYALAIILGNWFFVEFLMLTKLPHYLLPSYAAIAFLIATVLIRCMRRQRADLTRPSFLVGAGGWAMGATLLAAAPWFAAGFFPKQFSYEAAAAFTAAGVIYSLFVMGSFMQKKIAQGAAAMGLGMIVVIAIFFGLYLPSAKFLRVPVEVGRTLDAHGVKGDGDVVMTDFNEPTVAFYTNGVIMDGTSQFLKKQPLNDWPQWIVLTQKGYDHLSAADQSRLKTVASFRGLNYAGGGKIVDVLVVQKQPAPTVEAMAPQQKPAR